MLSLISTVDEDVIHDYFDSWKSSEDVVHPQLEYLWCRGDSEGKAPEIVSTERHDECREFGAVFCQWYLPEPTGCVKLAEDCRSCQSVEDVIQYWQGVVLSCDILVQTLQVNADAYTPVLAKCRHHGRTPGTLLCEFLGDPQSFHAF